MSEDNKCEVCGKEFMKVHKNHLCSKRCRKIKELNLQTQAPPETIQSARLNSLKEAEK